MFGCLFHFFAQLIVTLTRCLLYGSCFLSVYSSLSLSLCFPCLSLRHVSIIQQSVCIHVYPLMSLPALASVVDSSSARWRPIRRSVGVRCCCSWSYIMKRVPD